MCVWSELRDILGVKLLLIGRLWDDFKALSSVWIYFCSHSIFDSVARCVVEVWKYLLEFLIWSNEDLILDENIVIFFSFCAHSSGVGWNVELLVYDSVNPELIWPSPQEKISFQVFLDQHSMSGWCIYAIIKGDRIGERRRENQESFIFWIVGNDSGNLK